MKHYWIFIFVQVLCFGTLVAQERLPLTDKANVDYMQTTGVYSALYYGVEYEGYPRSKNHPFLVEIPCVKARLFYQNVTYPEVMLKLDLWRDELIVCTPDLRYVVLFPDNVGFAVLHGKQVIYFQMDSLLNSPSTGYYFLLYDGNNKVLEKQSALLREKLYPGRIERNFEFKTRYYLLMDDVYYPIKNKSDLLKILAAYKKQLKRFISANNLNYRKNAPELLIRTMGEYEKLVSKL